MEAPSRGQPDNPKHEPVSLPVRVPGEGWVDSRDLQLLCARGQVDQARPLQRGLDQNQRIPFRIPTVREGFRGRIHQCAELEARVGIEPTNEGFADLSLTTWLPRPGSEGSVQTIARPGTLGQLPGGDANFGK